MFSQFQSLEMRSQIKIAESGSYPKTKNCYPRENFQHPRLGY
ncbi:hypothetical protein BH695_0871 [Microcystis aeruginosa PCC 7806SL]|uniref:Uncharacterized protein n=1 Tax=Microcystis aeruginosa PCC 7806SL TaxID=1903187 RepID=A0AB33BGR5_MICA7|nr:hypothetical protein BH695_0871 [Microcystis aeruginosa PCC 7806SL]